MEGVNKRQMEIITKLNKNGFVKAVDLCEEFNVSSVTIRKDLNFLENKGILFRTHGGASKQSLYTFERTIDEKESLQVEQKKKIASLATTFIKDNNYIILASGTTVHYLSRFLKDIQKLTVLTSSLFVSVELCNTKNVEVIQLGGQVRKSSNSVTGNIAESVLKNFSCNTLFLGVDGIDVDFGITTTNFSEASLNKTMIAAAEKVIVLTDSSKIGKRSFSKIGDILDVHILITDDAISHKHKKELENLGIKVVIA